MRKILVSAAKKFILTVPDDAKLTFGPWSPPSDKSAREPYDSEGKRGTLRIYGPGPTASRECLAVFSGVVSFRDMSLGYAEEIVKEEGATIWHDDERGYYRDAKVERTVVWSPSLEGG